MSVLQINFNDAVFHVLPFMKFGSRRLMWLESSLRISCEMHRHVENVLGGKLSHSDLRPQTLCSLCWISFSKVFQKLKEDGALLWVFVWSKVNLVWRYKDICCQMVHDLVVQRSKNNDGRERYSSIHLNRKLSGQAELTWCAMLTKFEVNVCKGHVPIVCSCIFYVHVLIFLMYKVYGGIWAMPQRDARWHSHFCIGHRDSVAFTSAKVSQDQGSGGEGAARFSLFYHRCVNAWYVWMFRAQMMRATWHMPTRLICRRSIWTPKDLEGDVVKLELEMHKLKSGSWLRGRFDRFWLTVSNSDSTSHSETFDWFQDV